MKQVIRTNEAPKAIGTYSQAIKSGNTVYLSGQIGLDPASNELVSEVFSDQLRQVFKNLSAVANAAGGTLSDVMKLNIYLISEENYADVNKIMAEFCEEPYPARAAFCVKALPKNALVEIDGVMMLGE